MTPDRLQFALTDGLCLWLHMVNHAVSITGWTAAPLAASPDTIKLTLAFQDEQVPFTQFTLRKHQVGLDGLQSVLAMLKEIAPMIDTPMDIPQRQSIPLTLSLT